MPIFFHSTLLPHDPTGFSIWLQEHYLEHAQFVRIFQSQAKPIFIPDYNFALWGEDKQVQAAWLQAHEATHQALRTYTGVSGIDLADVDLSQDDQFFEWIDDHAAEHADIRAALGLH